METELSMVEIAMVILALFVAGSVAALIGGLVEWLVIRPIGRRRGWYE